MCDRRNAPPDVVPGCTTWDEPGCTTEFGLEVVPELGCTTTVGLEVAGA